MLFFVPEKENRNVLRKWLDFPFQNAEWVCRCVCVCVTFLWIHVNNDSKFEFNGFLIYVHRSHSNHIHACNLCRFTYGGEWIRWICFFLHCHAEQRKITASHHANAEKKNSIIKLKLYCRRIGREKYAIYANSNQILNANVKFAAMKSTAAIKKNAMKKWICLKSPRWTCAIQSKLTAIELVKSMCWLQNKCKFLNQSIQWNEQ